MSCEREIGGARRIGDLGCSLTLTRGLLRSSMILRTSSRLEAGWWPTSGGLQSAADGAYDDLLAEQPELRSADGPQIVVTCAQPPGGFHGNVHIARITLR